MAPLAHPSGCEVLNRSPTEEANLARLAFSLVSVLHCLSTKKLGRDRSAGGAEVISLQKSAAISSLPNLSWMSGRYRFGNKHVLAMVTSPTCVQTISVCRGGLRCRKQTNCPSAKCSTSCAATMRLRNQSSSSSTIKLRRCKKRYSV
jgi:hypothetical protein